MTTISSIVVDYEELEGSPVEEVTREGFSATRMLRCRWEDRFELCRQLIGGTDSSGRLFIPSSYPERPDALVENCKPKPWFKKGIKPESGDLRRAAYDYAQINVTYKTPDGASDRPDDEETLVSESLEPNAEFMTLPGKFFWDKNESESDPQDDALGAGGAPAKLLRSLDWVYTRHQLTSLSVSMLNLIGTVNSTSIKSNTLGWTFDEETLLYNPPSLRRVITTEGVKAWEATLRFSYRPKGWNKFFNPDTGKWQEVFLKNAEEPAKAYELEDLKQLVA